MSVLKMVEAPPRPQARAHLDTNTEHATPAERAALGAQDRAEVPRESHADFKVPADRPDPITLLEEQERPIGFVLSHAAGAAISYDGDAPEGFRPGED